MKAIGQYARISIWPYVPISGSSGMTTAGGRPEGRIDRPQAMKYRESHGPSQASL